jgi:starch phosphorylase
MTQPPPSRLHDARVGLDLRSLRRDVDDHVRFTRAKDPATATPFDRYYALALAARDRLVQRWIDTQRTYYANDVKRAYYLSAEFLLGRAMIANLQALDIYDDVKLVLAEMGADLDELAEQEPDAGLGNGGLGRLAACFLESMATLGLPGQGYGIRYEFGIFEQAIRNGYQVERADEWLKFGNPWEVGRPEYTVPVGFGGTTMHVPNERGGFRVHWEPKSHVLGVPYDTPIAGHRTSTINTLRLWAARASEEFDFALFNEGDYLAAVERKNASEVISKVLYPNDSFERGRELRLQQEYFFVACSIHDIVWRYRKAHPDFTRFSEKVAIQLNDTHPAVAIAELMRVLVDLHHVPWDAAWRQTVATFGYTNHTLLPEALERWPLDLFRRLLPRHAEIIGEINRRFLRDVIDFFPQGGGHVQRMSIIDDGPNPHVRMAHLAVVGSHSVNGVAKLHSELVQSQLLRDFHELYPERFNNKTNGVTPRRWLLECNPRLSDLITRTLGDDGWVTDLERLADLEPHVAHADFRAELRAIKAANKERLRPLVEETIDVRVDPDSIFDVQIKRLHEYKRQHLCVLHAVALYLRAKRGEDVHPRTIVLAAKAAPGYRKAKLIIKLIHAVADVVNRDRRQSAIRLAFLPNYRVSLAERIIPAANVSEQISTAGMEASGTGNMKLAMNGALTVGTLDGANIEIREAVGADNFFLFGHTAEEIHHLQRERRPGAAWVENDPLLGEALELVRGGYFSPDEPDLFAPLVDHWLGYDEYMTLADFAPYDVIQREVELAFREHDAWSHRAGLNVARMGRFSSDRTIREYASEIWNIAPIEVQASRPDAPAPSATAPLLGS